MAVALWRKRDRNLGPGEQAFSALSHEAERNRELRCGAAVEVELQAPKKA